MIALTRVRTVEAVPKEFYGEGRITNNISLIKSKLAGAFAPEKSKSSVWKSDIWGKAKAQLLRETFGKCAYCESPTSVVAYGDVEHFRPKSKYWWLAYCYENYLPSCTICNQRFKGDRFAVGPNGKPWAEPEVKPGLTEAQIKSLAKKLTTDALVNADGLSINTLIKTMKSEAALLIHPYFQDPSDYLAYLAIPETKEVLVVPKRPSAKPVVEACEAFFGINRQELRDERYRHYATYVTYRYTLAVPNLPEKLKKSITKRMEEMTRGNLRYTGMIRFFEEEKLEELPWDFDV